MISGASRGIGRAVAKRFAREGAVVCMCARHVEQLRGISLEIMAAGGRSFFEQTDISDERQAEEFLSLCSANFGAIDVLVNNAGMLGPRVPLSQYSSQEWEKVLSVNLNGLFFMTKHAIPRFPDDGGSIINVSSSVGKIAKPLWGAYGRVKIRDGGFLACARRRTPFTPHPRERRQPRTRRDGNEASGVSRRGPANSQKARRHSGCIRLSCIGRIRACDRTIHRCTTLHERLTA